MTKTARHRRAMTILLVCTAVLPFAEGAAQGPTPKPSAVNADSWTPSEAAEWAMLVRLRPWAPKRWSDPDRLAWEDLVKRYQRDHGLELITRRPAAVPPPLWLRLIVEEGPPDYYANIVQAAAMERAGTPWLAQIDTVAKRQGDSTWAQHYPTLRTAFFSDREVSATDKATFLNGELGAAIRSLDVKLHRGEPVSSEAIRALHAQSLAAATAAVASDLSFGKFWFAFRRWRYADPAAFREYLRAAQASPNTAMRQWAQGQTRLMALVGQPFPVSGLDRTGHHSDLAQYRGQIVFLDFWSTGCSGCIEALPYYQALYSRWHAQGVEFVGVNLGWPYNQLKPETVLAKAGVTFPVILSSQTSEAFGAQYGLEGMPFHVMLDREGRVVEYGQFSDTELEPALTRMLAAGRVNTGSSSPNP